MKYRDHRGTLTESMKTVRNIDSINELKQHLNTFFKQFGKEVEEIQFKYACFDDRIGWYTYNVLQRLKGEEEFTIVGMSNEKL